jgi:4-amino-4-deoxy-L-arabinose transferase-like glycosyltransferase
MSLQEKGPARVWLALPFAATLLFAGLALHAGRIETPTIDEFAHLPSGHAIVAHGALDLYAKNPPLGKVLLALPGTLAGDVKVPVPREPPFGWGPWQYGRRFMRANATGYLAIFARARITTVAFALLAAALVFGWARELFGTPAAAITTALFATSPTLLAHGHLATLDVACMTTLVASVYAVRWAYRARPPLDRAGLRFALAGLGWGIALLVKFTAVLLAPVWIAFALVLRRSEWRRGVAELALLGGVALVVVNAGMGFRGSFAPLGDYRFGSDFARGVQARLPGSLPVPLPLDYVRGFDAQKRDIERGEFPAYLRGEWSRDGWWYYEAVALAVKTPLPLLAMLALAPLALWRRRPPPRELGFLLLPVAILGALLTSQNQLNVGIRYLLPLYPFVFIVLAGLWSLDGRAVRGLGLAVVALYAIGAIRQHPAHLGYFNAIAGGPQGGHRWLLDSNLDWGQDLYRLAPALEARGLREPIWLLYFGHVDPGLYGLDFRVPPDRPVPGVIAVSVSYLAGFPYPAAGPDGRPVRVGADAVAWLRDQEPVERLGSIWLFDRREARP